MRWIGSAIALAILAVLGFGPASSSVEIHPWKQSGAIGTTGDPLAFILSPDGKRLYVGGVALFVVNTKTMTVIRTIPTGRIQYPMAISKDGAYLYLLGDDEFKVLDTRTWALTNTSTGGYGGLTILRSGNLLMPIVSDNLVVIWDTARSVQTASFRIDSPVSAAAGKSVFFASSRASTISEVDPTTGRILRSMDLRITPRTVVLSPHGDLLYVAGVDGGRTPNAEADAGAVAVISTKTWRQVATIPVKANPFGLAISPDGSFVYTTSGSSSGLTVIDASRNAVIADVPLQASPWAGVLAVSGDGGTIYVAGQNTLNVVSVSQKPPGAPKSLRVTLRSSKIVQVSWSPGLANQSAITNYVLRVSLDKGKTWKHSTLGTNPLARVPGLNNPGQSALIQVAAKNALGTGPWSARLTVSTTTNP